MDDLRDKKLVNRNEVIVSGNDVIKHLKLLVYIFCNHNSPNIEKLLKILKLIHQESERRNLGVEIVFVPLDFDPVVVKTHFSKKHGDWYAVPVGDFLIGELIFKYGIIKTPTIMVLRREGEVVAYDAEPEIINIGLNVLVTWPLF